MFKYIVYYKLMSVTINKYKNKGLSGLSNLGNTCFINTCMQILSHTYELNDIFENSNIRSRLNGVNDTALFVEWDNLRTILWKENCVVSPGKFIKTIQKLSAIKQLHQFTGHNQNDLPEFLLFVVDTFHNSLRREVNMNIVGKEETKKDKLAAECFQMIKKMYTKDYSEIWNIFYGVHVSQITSVNGDKILTRTPEPFFMINLPIPQNIKEPTLKQCFELYVTGEKLDGDNAWYNEKTKEKEPVIKNIRYWSLPKIMVIDLKRFNEKGVKNQKLVSFPINDMDMSPYVIGYKKNTYKYELYGVANHSGGTMGGHYFAYVKNANDKWYNFNDTNVSEIKDVTSVITPKAYCLFYRKTG
jgi:ubiquitin C-terminal hydrolase